MAENPVIDVRGYYHSLSKKEKGKFLRYLTVEYGYPASTMIGKLRSRPVSPLRRDEEMNLAKTINEGLWKQ